MATAFAESPPVPARLRPDPPRSLIVSGCPAFTSNERGIHYEGRIGVKVHSSARAQVCVRVKVKDGLVVMLPGTRLG